MDTRDSTSQSAPTFVTAGATVGCGGEEDAALSVAAALAKDAALHFQSHRFVECLDVLNQLVLMKGNDPKVKIYIAMTLS